MFGQKAIDTLPEARSDLGEAALCLAFQRYTAYGFHLMRAMEQAVCTIGHVLEITVRDKSGNYLSSGKLIANVEIKLKELKKSDKDMYDRWQPVMGLLYCVKDAWRNDTMHPSTVYCEQQARAAFDAVKTFLQHLAKKV